MRAAGVKVSVLQMKREISPISDIRALIGLYRRIRRTRPDIVHTHNSKAGFLGRLAARIAGVPVVIHTPHCFAFMNEGFGKFEKVLYLYLEKFAGLFTDRLITVSKSQEMDIVSRRLIRQEKVCLIENSVDVSRFIRNGKVDIQKKKKELGLDESSLILGTVGVLNESKGHKFLIEALSRVIKDGFDARLIIAGEGYLQEELEALSQKMGVSSRANLLGYRYDIPEILSVMDVFVFTSLWEGMPLALLEAMAQGLPVVSTDVHGAVDLIRNNETGILVKKKDAIGLAGAIEYIISHRKEAKAMGERAQRLIRERYSLDKHIKKLEGLYTELASNPLRS